MLGNEEQGLSPEVVEACHALVTIQGSGRVESLNVSATAAVLLWESTQRRVASEPSATSVRVPNRRPDRHQR